MLSRLEKNVFVTEQVLQDLGTRNLLQFRAIVSVVFMQFALANEKFSAFNLAGNAQLLTIVISLDRS
jgi:ABC-type methionine transport system ATPase subunit